MAEEIDMTEHLVNTEEDDDEFVPVKRKRGRPPKPQQSSNTAQQSGSKIPDENSSFQLTQSVRRNNRISDMQRNTAHHSQQSSCNANSINLGVSNNSINQKLMENNGFNILTDNSGEVIATKKRPERPKSSRIPEIKVLGVKYNDIQILLAPLKIINLQIKLTVDGIRVRLHASADFLAVCDVIRKANKDFYTHDLPENRRARYVLYGVPDLDINEITTSLKEQGVAPDEVRRMKLKTKRYDEEANYIVYRLRKIKAVCFAICRWEHYNNVKKGPIQCHRCQNLGHGLRNCN
jgi:hypothetical protein